MRLSPPQAETEYPLSAPLRPWRPWRWYGAVAALLLLAVLVGPGLYAFPSLAERLTSPLVARLAAEVRASVMRFGPAVLALLAFVVASSAVKEHDRNPPPHGRPNVPDRWRQATLFAIAFASLWGFLLYLLADSQ